MAEAEKEDRARSEPFPGSSEMHRRVRAHDWAASALGPVSAWPQGLKSLARTVLASPHPMLLTWGPGLIQLYNDAYARLMGDKHPAALGHELRLTLGESWDTLGPMLHEVMERGVALWTEALLLRLERSGYREESYFRISHAPAEDDTGRIAGVFAVCSEVTQQRLGERRTRLLHELTSGLGGTRDVEHACREVLRALSAHALDVPFALLYLHEPASGTLLRRGEVGVVRDAADPAPPWEEDAGPMARATRGEAVLVEGVERCLRVMGGPWREPVRSALLLPIASAEPAAPLGVLVVGVSPNRALDEGYRSFHALLVGQISLTLRNAREHEEAHRRAEDLARLDRVRTAFFSDVSHEFRTPLTLILGSTGELLEGRAGELPATARAELELLRRNAGQLLRLANTLLDFSRAEAGRIEARFTPTDFSALSAELASGFRSAVERAGLSLHVDCPPLPEPVYLDPELWEKVVLNLVSNAFKFTLQGGVSVRTFVHEGRAVLEVRDTGTGIPAEELPHLFERFHRVKDVPARTREGTGLGLALVREMVKLHGGQVRVDSEPERGTTFRVELPLGHAHLPPERMAGPRVSPSPGTPPQLAEAERWTPLAPPPPPGPSPSREQPGRVLLADDNADMRDYLQRLLSTEYQVEAVADGQQALESALAHPPDLVISDVMMPRLDGVGLLRGLRAAPHTRELPILLLSARASEQALVEGLESGADDYLVKPFGARELLARVRAHLERVRMRQEVARERARGDGLLEAVRARDAFLSMASHELKTPLTAFQLQLGAIERGLNPASQTHVSGRLETARRSVRRLANLIEQLLDVSQLTTGRMQLAPAQVDLSVIVRDVVATSREEAQRHGTPLTVQLESPLPGWFDPDRMSQVVHHLLSNALKFGQGRPVELTLRSEGTGVRLTVVDHGIGIPVADRNRVFERFERAVSVRNYGGLGLGLWVTRQVVEAHQGSILIEDTPGGGATFEIFLPRRDRKSGPRPIAH